MTIFVDRLAGQTGQYLHVNSAQVAYDSEGGIDRSLPMNKHLGCRSNLPAVRSYIDLRRLLLQQNLQQQQRETKRERQRQTACLSVCLSVCVCLLQKELADRVVGSECKQQPLCFLHTIWAAHSPGKPIKSDSPFDVNLAGWSFCMLSAKLADARNFAKHLVTSNLRRLVFVRACTRAAAAKEATANAQLMKEWSNLAAFG